MWELLHCECDQVLTLKLISKVYNYKSPGMIQGFFFYPSVKSNIIRSSIKLLDHRDREIHLSQMIKGISFTFFGSCHERIIAFSSIFKSQDVNAWFGFGMPQISFGIEQRAHALTTKVQEYSVRNIDFSRVVTKNGSAFPFNGKPWRSGISVAGPLAVLVPCMFNVEVS